MVSKVFQSNPKVFQNSSQMCSTVNKVWFEKWNASGKCCGTPLGLLEHLWDHNIQWLFSFLELLWVQVEHFWDEFRNTIGLWIGMVNVINLHFSLDWMKVCQWNLLHFDHHLWHYTVLKVFDIVYSPFNSARYLYLICFCFPITAKAKIYWQNMHLSSFLRV